MRSTEAIPGEIYRLRKRSRIKVEMLDTPPEVRAAHRMRVKFLTGVKAGAIAEIPSVAIAPLPDSDSLPAAPQRSELGGLTFVPASGSLRPGATVLLDGDKAGFHWTVNRLLPDGMIEITTPIFERPTAMTVDGERLQLVGPRTTRTDRRVPIEAVEERRDADTFDQDVWVSNNLSPVRLRRHLDVVADSLLLGPRCLRSCSDRFYPGVSLADCADRFRAEIRVAGVVQRDREGGKMDGRIRVPGRFELILPDDFQAGIATTIEDPAVILSLKLRPSRRTRRPKSYARRTEERPRRRRPGRPQSQ